MASVDKGPGKPARISVQRPRGPHRGGREQGDVYCSLAASKTAFSESEKAQKNEMLDNFTVKKNGGTRLSRQNKGRQGAI